MTGAHEQHATKKRKLELPLESKENSGAAVLNSPHSPSFSSFFRPQKGKMPLLPSSCFETTKNKGGKSGGANCFGLNGAEMGDLNIHELMASVMR